MTKEKAGKKRAAAGSKSPTLEALRAKIDRLDQQLVKVMNQRAKVALEIGKVKDANGMCVYAPAREVEVLRRVTELNDGPLSERCIRAIYRELISGSRSLEKQLRVAYLGPAYTYSHLAAIHRFGQSVEMVPVATIAAVFEEINGGQADHGIVPIENSTDGRVADTLDMFARLRVRICGEVQLRIHHNLLGKCSRADVKEVYSKPQALSQCRNWMARHLPTGAHDRSDQHDHGRAVGPRKAGRRGDRQLTGRRAIRAGRAGRRHRGQSRQSDPVCRDWR